MTAIINTKLILENGIIWDGVLLYEGERIVALGRADQVTVPEGAEIIDAKGLYTAPGLVDVHCHGGPDYRFYQDIDSCVQHFIRHGVTGVLATIGSVPDLDEIIETGKRIRQAQKSGAGQILIGMHMEGPYMSGGGGNQNRYKWTVARGIKSEDYIPLIQENKDLLKMWAVDPNREGLEPFLQYAKAEIPHLVFAYGHSGATAAKCKSLKHYGFKVRTHANDSGQAKGRAQGTIGAGGDHFCIQDPDMFIEVIADESGVHVDPELIQYFIRMKGVERTILISDSVAHQKGNTNNLEAGIHYGPDLNYDDRGYLSGSRLTLDCAVRNVMTHTDSGLCQAIRMASLSPAQMLGMDREIGSLEAGKLANLILIDDMVHVKKVILKGQLAVEDSELKI